MKHTKDNLKKFVDDWYMELDNNPQIMHPEDVLHDLEVQFELIPKKKISKTLMEIFEEEDAKKQEEPYEIPF